MLIYYRGETRTAEDWTKDSQANPHRIKAPIIKARLAEGYAGSALFRSQFVWDNHPALQVARPRTDYERRVRRMIKAEIPQFRFDIIVEVVKKVGLSSFQRSSLRKQITKGNWAYAVLEVGLLAFNGSGEGVRMSWMKEAADWVRRWQNPWEA